MAFDASNLLLHVKRIACSSIRLCYQYASDYPVVLGAGMLLLFLHKLWPSLFMFLLSSSPVFVLTALLLGALLTYGEPCAPPVTGEETLENQQTSSRKSRTSATDRSTEEIENVAVVSKLDKSFESQIVCTEERTIESIVHDTRHDEEKFTSVQTDIVLCTEGFSEFAKSNVAVESEEQTKETSVNVEMQKFESTHTESYHNEVLNKYQLGELMSSCWQPVTRQDPCCDSESDISGSSSDASMTDILPMLDELNPPVNLGTGHPSSTFRDSLNSSSDDEEDSEGDGDLDSNKDGAKEKKDDTNNSEDDVDSFDAEKDSDVDSLMERRRAKNILKLELDKKLMDMQAADTIQKMEAASCFCVQVPSISTPRPKPFVLSNGSEETVELPKIPDSAPSVLLPWRKPFDTPFDQIVDSERKLQGTWTPRSYFPSTQYRKNGNLYLRKYTYLQQHNYVTVENSEHIGKDTWGGRSDSDSEQAGISGKLPGSLEAHMSGEIKIVSAAISDACVLEANYEGDENGKNSDFSADAYSFCIKESVCSSPEKKDSVCAGKDQSAVCALSKETDSSQHIVETDSITISEVNSLFKCLMEEVPVQSISESSIGQPLTVKLEDELDDTLSADCGTPVVEASSVDELNSRISLFTNETLTSADRTCDEELVQNRWSEAFLAENGHSSQLPIKDEPIAVNFEGTSNVNGELPVLESNLS